MREVVFSGHDYLTAVNALCQRVRSAHPTVGIYEGADFQWWWRIPRSTDSVDQLFWVDADGHPEAAVVATDWGDAVALDPIVMPDSGREILDRVVARGLEHAAELGFDEVDFVADRSDELSRDVLASHGFTKTQDELVDAWLDIVSRPDVADGPAGYRLFSRAERPEGPHPMTTRSGPEVEARFHEAPLYNPELDLTVFDEDSRVAGYGIFWFDPASRTGLVEPMRTEEEHQRRGLARYILTEGLDRLDRLGAERVKIAWDPNNIAADRLYRSAGFGPPRQCVMVSRPDSTSRRY